MKPFVTLLVLIALVAVSLAIPPQEVPTPRSAWQGLQTQTVYVAPKVAFSANSDIGSYVATVQPFDSALLAQGIQTYDENARAGAEPLYPVTFRLDGCPTWSVYDGDGNLVASTLVVGFDPPPADMAYKLLPRGNALDELSNEVARRYELLDFPTPPPGIHGTVQFGELLVAASDMDTTIMFQGAPTPVQPWWELTFADQSPLTPGGRTYLETVRGHIWNSSNHQVSLVPDTERCPTCPLPGLLNPVTDGYVQAIRLPLTTAQIASMSEATVMNDYILPIADSLGIDLGDHAPYPHHAWALIWMQNWAMNGWGTNLWPHAYLGAGKMTSGIYYWSDGDVSFPGVIIHELGHAIFYFLDHYGVWGDGNLWDVMGYAVYNPGGPPHFSSPDCYGHRWWPAGQLTGLANLGPRSIPRDYSVFWQNPFCDPQYPEREFLTTKYDTLGDHGIGFTGTRLISWITYPEQICGQFG